MPQVTLHNAGGIGLDTTDFKVFARALRKAEPKLASGLRTKLRAAGALVAVRAHELAGQHSESIPPSIKVRLSGATVSVIAGGKGVPVAGLFELGNQGGRSDGTFRHPVFGNKDVWVTQAMFPFLGPAMTDTADEAMVLIVDALDEAITVAVSKD